MTNRDQISPADEQKEQHFQPKELAVIQANGGGPEQQKASRQKDDKAGPAEGPQRPIPNQHGPAEPGHSQDMDGPDDGNSPGGLAQVEAQRGVLELARQCQQR